MIRSLLVAVALLLVALPTAGAAPTKAQNGQISFWSDRDDGTRAQVYVMDADGTHAHRLTSLFSAKRGDFSADGRRIVFDGRGYETLRDFDIFVMNADGTDVRALTKGPDRDTQASWSPDGRLVSFVRTKNESSNPSIWVVRADGTGAHRVASGGSAVWSPDGKRLAVGTLGGLRIMRADGTHAKKIVSGETEVAGWSRDGHVLFTRWVGENTEVYVVGSTGYCLRRLTRSSGQDYAADFSPDGSKILFSSDRRGGYLQVYVMNFDGTGVRHVSRSQSSDWATSWQPLPTTRSLARAAKEFHPGDLRICNARDCVAVNKQAALDAIGAFYYGPNTPARVNGARLGAPYFQLRFRNGYSTGIVATARLDRFLSYGVNLNQFATGHWYRLPAVAAEELKRLTTDLKPLRLTRAAILKSR